MTKISHEENVGADLSSKDVTEDKPKCRLCQFYIYTVMSSMRKFRLVKTKHDSLVMHKLVHRGQHATHILL